MLSYKEPLMSSQNPTRMTLSRVHTSTKVTDVAKLLLSNKCRQAIHPPMPTEKYSGAPALLCTIENSRTVCEIFDF